ncbi:MAG: hypothetical protein AABW79_04405 [Nanoarchaeota archaeon]
MKREEIVDNSFGISSVIFSILGILFSIVIPFVGLILAVLGLGFGLMQKKRTKNKWSKLGIILGVIGILLGLVFSVLTVIYAFKIAQESGALPFGVDYG